MRKITAAGLVLLFLSAQLFHSCKKYEDGPAFTLLTKKKRLTGTWFIESATVNGHEYTKELMSFFGSDYSWTIRENGSYSETGNVPDNGLWSLIEKKEKIQFKSLDTTFLYSIEIRRLTKNEFWYHQLSNAGDLYEVHMKK